VNKIAVDAGRVTLPADAVKPFGEPTTREDIPVWLFLVDLGHLRVMADQNVRAMWGGDPSGVNALDLATREERERLAALRMRLFSTSIKPPRRLVIPAEVFDACEEQIDRRHVWIDYSTGCVDVYTVTYRQRLLAMTSDKLFTNPEAD
jgi:hypothetical protein